MKESMEIQANGRISLAVGKLPGFGNIRCKKVWLDLHPPEPVAWIFAVGSRLPVSVGTCPDKPTRYLRSFLDRFRGILKRDLIGSYL